MNRVGIVIGSENDIPYAVEAEKILNSFGVYYDRKVLSAHRTPEALNDFLNKSNCDVYIAMAGLAAHLAGAIAAKTIKPVIGVPLDVGPLNGVDALLSTVMMPTGIPVATVGIGNLGAKNAAYLAIHVLAMHQPILAGRLEAARITKREEVLNANK